MASSQFPLIFFIVVHFYRLFGADYIGIPESTSTITVALKHPLDLKCIYNGSNETIQFLEWYKDNATLSSDKSGNYEVRKTRNESTLTIKAFDPADSEVKRWFVRTNEQDDEEPISCQYSKIILKPSPQGIRTNVPEEKIIDSPGKLIKRYLGEKVSMKCLIKPNRTSQSGTNTALQWTFRIDNQTFILLPEGVGLLNDDEIEIEQVNISHRGYYSCTLNDVSFTVFLRVKDQWIALWPFLGIISAVLTVIMVVVIYEKRRKSIQKAAAKDDEETDHVSDPLVRSTEHESEKRAVKA